MRRSGPPSAACDSLVSMNIHRPIHHISEPTPHRFTVSEYEALSRISLDFLDRKFELWDGVIVEMPMDGPLTSRWNGAINRWLQRSLSDDYAVKADQTLVLNDRWAPDPDHHVFPADIREEDLKPADVLLVIEVAHTTLKTDLGQKAEAYAESGIREYWVIDPAARCVHVHLLNEQGVYDPPALIGFTDTVTARLIPALTLRLADLPRITDFGSSEGGAP